VTGVQTCALPISNCGGVGRSPGAGRANIASPSRGSCQTRRLPTIPAVSVKSLNPPRSGFSFARRPAADAIRTFRPSYHVDMIEATTVDPRPLTVLYRDEHVVAIDKPAGLQVHRSRISAEDSDFVLQRLRDQIGQLLYPVHRLDRPTSGVLLFALNPDAARALTAQFQARSPRRRYLAIVRGYTELEGRIERPLRNAPDKPARDAVTCYRRLATVELPYAVSRYPTSRYSLVDVRLHTG